MNLARRKLRYLTAAALVAALAAACSSNSNPASPKSSPSPDDGTPKSLTVWYMDGSLSDEVISSLTTGYKDKHPNVTVTFEKQAWDGIGQKLTTALLSNTPPDVIEVGNTQVAQYAQSGGLADLSAYVDQFENHDSWLPGLAEPGKWDGKTYGIPFYAGDRTVIYRTDLFEKAGITDVPTSWDELIADGKKLAEANKDDPKFMAMYLPGQEWYTLASLIWDEGGDIAVKDGDKWKGALDSDAAKAAITRYKDLYDQLSKAPKDTDEANPQQYEVMGKGHVGMMIGLGWEYASVPTDDNGLKGKVGVFALPSKTAGKLAPPFVGGSDFAVPAAGKNQAAAVELVKYLTGTAAQTLYAEKLGLIPNATALEGVTESNPVLKVQAAAAAVGKVTPVDPGWANVENTPNPLKTLLTDVLSGKPLDAAVKTANDEIAQRMNS